MNETGTVLFYSPGMLTGGTVTHKCHKARAVSYYLEVHSNPKLEILNVGFPRAQRKIFEILL